MKITLALLPLLAVPINAHPFEDPIVTDRPGFSTYTHTVKPGKINVELGYEYSSNNDRGVDQVTQMYPQLELRAGITANTELSLYWTRWNISVTNEQPSETTVADISIGGKYRVHQSPEYNLTMPGWLSFPSGSSPLASDNIDPILALLWDITCLETFSCLVKCRGSHTNMKVSVKESMKLN